MTAPIAIVTGGFDDLRSPHVRFLEEAARRGRVRVWLWPDAAIEKLQGRPPKFPLAERQYFLGALRFVDEVRVWETAVQPDALPETPASATWVIHAAEDTPAKRAFCTKHGLACAVLQASDLAGFPPGPPPPADSRRKKVIVTGCYDWLHSGHIRFFEEVSQHGDLYVAVGNDANVRHLKGDGHPLFSQDERRYLVGAVRFVTQAMYTTGWGWLDAEPEIQRLKPDIYAVNEDGDKPEKRAYCEAHGIQYLVLKRTPKPGLPRRQSTDLRGF